MKKKELKDLRTKKVNELKKMVADKKMQDIKIYSDRQVGKEKNLKKGANLRADISKILTIISEMEILAAETKNEESTTDLKKERKVKS